MTGSGTLADPYVIWDVNDLQNMALDLTAYYELGQDIDASATSGWNAGAGFVPIGDVTTRFRGSFDGRGYSITDLVINRGALNGVGLFGATRGVVIQNVYLVNLSITGRSQTGGLIGDIYGAPNPCTITNCTSSGTVDGRAEAGGLIGHSYSATITNCHSSCRVTGSHDDVGGLIGDFDGESSGSISSSSASGDVRGLSWVGGLIGILEDAAVSQCYATGDVEAAWGSPGGLVGTVEATGSISNSYSRGAVTAPQFAGGFVGINIGAISNSYSTGLVTATNGRGFCEDNSGTITNCFWDTETSGQATSDGGTGKTTAEMKDIDAFLFGGWDIEKHKTQDLAGGYPFLSWQIPGSSPIWYIYAPGTVSPIPIVQTLPATGVR